MPEEEKPSGRPYTLQEFVEKYSLPQLVSVTEGHYGTSDYFSMSEGIELILFFKKNTQAVIATAQHREEPYYIPLNCSLKFSPYQCDCKEHLTKSYYYKTVNDLLKRRDGLPKVVKVIKSRKTAPVLKANELIFPKCLSSKGTRLIFTDIRKEEVRLQLTCNIGFSTDPSDTKMCLADYVEHINEFPSSVMVFCDQETSRLISDIHNGMEMVLHECTMLYSCICSTDVHGEMNYPLIEVLTALPIEIKAISSPKVGLGPIYDTAKKIYETFNLSMLRTSVFLAQDDRHDYEEIKQDDDYEIMNFYDLEIPAEAYTKLSPVKHRHATKLKNPSVSVPSPPLPPRSWHNNPKVTKVEYTTSADQNRFYLRSFAVTDVLKLLDKINLGQFKGIFEKKNIDGKTLLSFTKHELKEELGIKDSMSQQELLDVISGHKTHKVK